MVRGKTLLITLTTGILSQKNSKKIDIVMSEDQILGLRSLRTGQKSQHKREAKTIYIYIFRKIKASY